MNMRNVVKIHTRLGAFCLIDYLSILLPNGIRIIVQNCGALLQFNNKTIELNVVKG